MQTTLPKTESPRMHMRTPHMHKGIQSQNLAYEKGLPVCIRLLYARGDQHIDSGSGKNVLYCQEMEFSLSLPIVPSI